MNLEKICEALSEVDELGASLKQGCAVGRLFYHMGKTKEQISNNIMCCDPYINMFDKLLVREYDMTENDEITMYNYNDKGCGETNKDRHTRVLAHYEGLLIECLISQSSSPVEEDLNHCEDVLIAR